MTINQVDDAEKWKKLLAYYVDCLREENRLHYVIKPDAIEKACFFLPSLDGSFLREEQASLSITSSNARLAQVLQQFVLGDPQSGRHPSVSFGYPFFVDSEGKLMPLLYVSVAGRHIDGGIGLTRESVEIGVNFAAVWEVLPGDKEIGLDEVFDKFETLEVQLGGSRFDLTLDLLVSQIEEIAGTPTRRVNREEFNPRGELPPYSIVQCPLLFHVRDLYTGQLLRELDQLLRWHNWDEVQPALRYLLTHAPQDPYPDVPDQASDPCLYVVPANDSQRRAVACARQQMLAVVTGPPGTGKSQLILNIVGDAVLRGETVLIASRNNRAVDVVYDRFLSQVDYPGTVRSGKREYRQRLPSLMQTALNIVHRGHLDERLEQVRGEYTELLRRIEEQQGIISEIEGLLHDRQAYQGEMRELAASLPESLRAPASRTQILLSPVEGDQLKAALRTLEEESVTLVERRRALCEGLNGVLVENRRNLAFLKHIAALERRSGISFDDIRPSMDVQDFSAIEGFLVAWESLAAAIGLLDRACNLESSVANLHRKAEEAQEGLPPGLVSDSAEAAGQFEAQREENLRQALATIRGEAKGLKEKYDRLAEQLARIRERAAPICRLFDILKVKREGDVVLPDFDLATLAQAFAVQEEVLRAHQVGMGRVALQQRLVVLNSEKADKLTEFETLLVKLEEQLARARLGVPVLLVAQIEPTGERGDHRTWKKAATQLSSLDIWCTRVRNGQLGFFDRVRRIFAPGFFSNHLRGRMRDLRPLFCELGIPGLVDEPANEEGFEEWADFVHNLTAFVRPCYLVARRRYVLTAQETYRDQVDREIVATSERLQEADTKFVNALTPLPDAISDAMLGGSWPFEAIDPAVVRGLAIVGESCATLVSHYEAIVGRLVVLQQDSESSDYLQAAVMALKLDLQNGGASELTTRATPAALVALVSTWLQFSHAVQTTYELVRAKHDLASVQANLDQVLGNLPGRIRHGVDLTAIKYSEELVQPMQVALSVLRSELTKQMEVWAALQEQATGLFRKNALEIPGLSKALEQAEKDPRYLSALLSGEGYDRPERLIDDLQLWKRVIGIWETSWHLSTVGERLKKYPTLDESRAGLDRLWKERLSLAGNVLTEKWRQIAAELSVDQVRAVGYYVDAIRGIAGDTGSYGTLKNQAERYFADALRLFPIWSTTNLSPQDLPLQAGLFDCVVIDEASQCDVPSALPLLFRSKRIVIIGDEQQLTHIATLPKSVHRQISERHGIGSHYNYRDVSLFKLASDSTAKVPGQMLLDEHYRSHEEIIEFSNRNFYDCALRLRTDHSHVPAIYQTRGCGVFWVNVKGQAQRPGPGNIFNAAERKALVALVRKLLQRLGDLDMGEAEIGIVTPFRAQSEHIGRDLKQLSVPEGRVLVGTVHTYQGNERDVMIFSTVATEGLSEGTRRFVTENPNLLNVAVTRARLTLIVVGDHDFFIGLPKRSCYYKLAAYVKDLGRVYPNLESLPLFQPVEEDERPFELGRGWALRKDAPYVNRMTLRRLLASCQDYVWWYDPYMSVDALDALVLALTGLEGQIREVRLLTSEMFWENRQKEPQSMTRKAITPLKRELEGKGITLQVAVTSYDPDDPPAHDRYLFSANRTVNMPPIRNIYQQAARLAEFLSSTVEAEEFVSWWQGAKVVLG